MKTRVSLRYFVSDCRKTGRYKLIYRLINIVVSYPYCDMLFYINYLFAKTSDSSIGLNISGNGNALISRGSMKECGWGSVKNRVNEPSTLKMNYLYARDSI